MNRSRLIRPSIAGALATGALLTFAGCGGGGGSDRDATGTLNLAITDAPVDDADQVWVRFTGVRVQPASGPAIDFDFDTPEDIDLLTLTGDNTATLLADEQVPAGAYNWLLLKVNAALDGEFDSYVVDELGGMVELEVPSGSRQGVRLVSGFTVLAGGSVSFVIDWDLRKALTNPVGRDGFLLRPALRITDLAEYGSITGTVADALTMDAGCTSDPETGAGNLVYVYQGDVEPVDIDGADPDPLTTAAVTTDPDAAGAYTYRATFLPPGDYTVAFSCQGRNDAPDAVDDITFVGAQSLTVVADQATTADF